MLIGQWIGYYQYEISALPFPLVIDFSEDGTAEKYDPNEGFQKVNWDWIQDELKVDTMDYVVTRISDELLELQHSDIKYVFTKLVEPAYKLPADSQLQIINDHFWITRKDYQYDDDLSYKEVVKFREEGRRSLKSYYYGADLLIEQQEKVCSKFSLFKNHLFYSESYRMEGCDTSYLNLMPVEFEDDKNFLLWEYKQRKALKKRYCKSEPFEISDSAFYKCKKLFIQPFYRTELEYKGDKPALQKHFGGIFEKQYVATDEGFISVIFTVNCEGKIGDYKMQLTDIDFKEKEFSLELLKDIVERVEKLEEWKIGKNDDDELVDSKKYLLFKMKEGRLVHILP